MQTILKLKKYAACAALAATAAGLAGCYAGPGYYGHRPYGYGYGYAYAAPAPAYGYYGYYGRPRGDGYYRGDRW